MKLEVLLFTILSHSHYLATKKKKKKKKNHPQNYLAITKRTKEIMCDMCVLFSTSHHRIVIRDDYSTAAGLSVKLKQMQKSKRLNKQIHK